MNTRPTTPITIPKQLQDERFRFIRVKDNKTPKDIKWTQSSEPNTNNYKWNDQFLQSWLQEGGNYGIVGGYGNLFIIDVDKQWFQDIALTELPETFTCTSGGKGFYHLFYELDEPYTTKEEKPYGKKFPDPYWDLMTEEEQKKAKERGEKNESGDLIGVGSQVVGANSVTIKKDGTWGTYKVFKDIPIKKLEKAEIIAILQRIEKEKRKELKLDEEKTTTKESKKKKTDKPEKIGSRYQEVANTIKASINLKEFMIANGVEYRKPEQDNLVCPFHASENGMNLGVTQSPENGHWGYHCFSCDRKGSIFDFMKEKSGWSFTKTLFFFAKKLNITLKPTIPVPDEIHDFDEFVKNIIELFKDKEILFYNPQDKSVVEVVEYQDIINKTNKINLSPVGHNRLFSIINKYANISIGKSTLNANVPELILRRLLDTEEFIESLPKMLRLLKVPTLFRIGDKIELAQEGYNPKLQAYLVKDAPKFIRMSAEKAKKVIYALLAEFPFKEEIDKTMAIAGLITPACRGLYTTTTKRSPLVLYEGNRAGVGKDYLAGCTHIIYNGNFIEQPALSSEQKFGGMTDEEIKKKITASLQQGSKLLHYSNLRGELNSTAFEGFLTSEIWEDRILGSTKMVSFNNETDVSVSANTGFTFTNDMNRRMIKVRLFVDIEDIRKKVFKNPDLHRKIKDNRGTFISAILSLVMDWNDAGRPTGESGFTGFTDWANVVGGIMHHHGFGDPCQIVDYGDDSGDTDTMYARQVWELMAIVSANTKQKEFVMKDITSRIKEKQIDDPQFLTEFNFINDNYRASTISAFGKFFKKHIGRIHNGIKMECINPEEKTGSRKRYTFIFLE